MFVLSYCPSGKRFARRYQGYGTFGLVISIRSGVSTGPAGALWLLILRFLNVYMAAVTSERNIAHGRVLIWRNAIWSWISGSYVNFFASTL
jgi:hypothetical protein